MTVYYCECCEEFTLTDPKEVLDCVTRDPYPMYEMHTECPECGEWDTCQEFTDKDARDTIEFVCNRLAVYEKVNAEICRKQLLGFLDNY